MTLLGQLKRFVRTVIPDQRLRAGFPDWKALLDADRPLWEAGRERSKSGPRVLVAGSVGGFAAGTVMESVLAAALTLRGADVRFLLCDEALPACFQSHIHSVPDPSVLESRQLRETLCYRCHPVAAELFGGTGLPILGYSELLGDAERRQAAAIAGQTPSDQIGRYTQDGLAVGEHALAGTLRFFARGELPGDAASETVLRRYFEASLLTASAVSTLLKRERFDVVLLHHGIYVPQGVIAEAARAAGVRLVTWNVAYRKSCFIFSHDDTYHHTLAGEPASAWENLDWNPPREKETMDYLASRLTGARDWIWFHEKPVEDVEKVAAECGVDFSKPVVGLLTNVFWDAQLHYRANAFANMLDWMVQTIAYFRRRPDLQLLIRIHPAEVRGTVPSRQPVLEEIRKAFPDWPANVFVIPPESNSSTYAAMYKCDAVLIYGTKTGVELSAAGIPVVVGGEAWIRGKGVTRDANSPAEYFRILDELPAGKRLEGAVLERARKYAYHFFFRRMIPLRFMTPADVPAHFTVGVKGPRDLLPGASPGLDVICDGILSGKPFVYEAEKQPVA